jgi:hypothetical protein
MTIAFLRSESDGPQFLAGNQDVVSGNPRAKKYAL